MDIGAVGLLIGMLGGVGSFWLGRRWRSKLMARRQAKDRAEMIANESRQQRRARERREKSRSA